MGDSLAIELSDESFEDQVLKSEKPALVDFWAPWCGPCKAMAPVLEKLAEHLSEELTVAKLNIDAHQKTAREYEIRSIPTFILFKGGQVVARLQGANVDKLIEFLQEHVGE
jgi:thioredoxin 1